MLLTESIQRREHSADDYRINMSVLRGYLQQLDSALGLSLPSWARDGAGPIVLVAVPSLIWIVAIYDAVAGAIMERR